MGRAPVALFVLLLLATPDGARAASRAQAPRARAAHVSARARPAKPAAKPRRARPPTLAEAQASMTAVMRDRTKRRYRHHWERAIAGLLRAARGRDAPEALLAAARARYALYRWSANEAARAEALRL